MTIAICIKRLKLNVTLSLLTIVTTLLTFSSLSTNAQILGGSGNGQSTPKEVEASKITAGGFSGDVSLFSGTYNSSYALGAVSTPDGLSFTATLSYSSSFSSGNEMPHSTGIPYGEGWNLDVPSISVSTEDYNKYTKAYMEEVNRHPKGIHWFSQDTLPTKKFTLDEIIDEGALYWFSPTVNIPGVASGRMVFKEIDNGNNPVFVLHQFERYIEARLLGNTWEIELEDGTIYSFGMIKANYREASNQRTSLTSLGTSNVETLDGTSPAVMNLVMPKAEITTWYITSITHPNKSGIISFKYEGFGKFDYFREYKQRWLNDAVRDYNNFIFIDTTIHTHQTQHTVGSNPNIPNGDDAGLPSVITTTSTTSQALELNGRLSGIALTVAYKDIFLKEVSTGYDKLVFDYESISTQGGAALMDLADPTVGRKDSLYSHQTVYMWGVNGTGFNGGWKRYHHMYSDALNWTAPGSVWGGGINYLHNINHRNPYEGTRPGTGFSEHRTFLYTTDVTESGYAPFNHSYFESPRVGQHLPAGDIYEIRTHIYTQKYDGANGFCNFDINIATGIQHEYGDYRLRGVFNNDPSNVIRHPVYHGDGTAGTGFIDHQYRPLSSSYNYSRKENLFTTFHRAIKWNPVFALSGNGVMETSNYFTMPNLPPQFGGFHIQVGPGNSDNHYGLSEHDALTYHGGTTIGANPRKSYYQSDSEAQLDAYMPYDNTHPLYFNFMGGHWSNESQVSKNTQIRTGDAIPANFGLGMPWRMLADMYSQYDEHCHPETPGEYFSFWYNRNKLYDNNITVFPNSTLWNHENVPTLADDSIGLQRVQLVRYTKNPYMLRHVKYYRMSYEDANLAITTNNQDLFWELISHTEFNYEIQQMGNYALVMQRPDYATSHDSYEWWLYENGQRNMFLLKNIKEIPVDGSTYTDATLPTTHFEYDTTQFINPLTFSDVSVAGLTAIKGKRIGAMSGEPFNANYAILTKIVNPLGGETLIEYDNNAKYTTSYQAGKLFDITPLLPKPSAPPSFTELYSKYQRATSYALQINMVVKSKTLKDKNNTTKKWDYVFNNRKGMSNDMPMTPNFKENTNPFAYTFPTDYSIMNNVAINRSKGFGNTIVYQPELTTGNRPYIKYYHNNTHVGTDASTYLLWGKLYKVENYDGQDNLMSRTEIEYDSKLAFESGYLRKYCYWETDQNGQPTVNCECDDEEGATVWDYAESIHNFSATRQHVGVGDFHGIYGDARSYESKMAHYIDSIRPNFLNSFFVYKKRETNTAYDKSCEDCTTEVGDGGDEEGGSNSTCYESIQTITDYEYYDADKDGLSQTENYKVFTFMTIDQYTSTPPLTSQNYDVNNDVQLMYEPSWQLAQKKTYSPQLPDAYTKEDYFYYYDMANEVSNLDMGGDWEILNDFYLLQDIRAKKMRNLVSEHRVTTKAAGQSPKTQTSYYLYERDWEDDASGSIYTMNNAFTLDTLHAPNYPCSNNTTPTFPQDCFLTSDPIAGDGTGTGGTGSGGTGTPSDPIEVEIDNSWIYTGLVTGQGGSGGGGGGSSDTIHYCLYDSIPEGVVYCPCEPEIYVDPSSPTEMQDIGSLLASKIWFRSTVTYTGSTPPLDGLAYIEEGNEYIPIIQSSAVSADDYIETYRVEERTPYGWVYREKDVKGMITRYDYVPTDIIEYYYCNILGFNSMKYFYGNMNFGKVASVIVAEGTPEELVSHYSYNPSGTIASIADPNGITLSYDYDEYNRMTKAYRNGQLLAESNYNRWDNDAGLATSTTFEQRTIQNYVETITHNDLTGTNFAKARAFVDPLGRNSLSAASVSNNPDRLIISAYTQYDTWDRAIHNYKPTIYQAATGTGMSNLDYHSAMNNTSLNTAPKTTQEYTADPRSRVVKAAKYGIDITSNHVVETDFCLVDGDDLLTELGISAATMSGWVQNSSSSYQRGLNMFLKTTIEDEDDKQVFEYGNAIGQKIATLRYDDAGQKVVTLFFYDSRGNLIKVINPENQSSRYLYNDLGQLYETQTIDGGYTRYIYNKSGQLVLEQDANGAANSYVRQYEYDIMGRMTEQSRMDYNTNPFASFSATNSLSWKNPTVSNSSTNHNSEVMLEKRWYYGLSFNTNDASILGQAKDYLNHSLTGTNGQLTHTISYDHRGTPIEYRFFSYNSEGLPKWEITQFNQNGIRVEQPGLMVRIDFAEYSLQGSLLTQNIDLDGNRTFDFQYHYTYDDWSRLKEIYISYDDQKANGYKVAEYQYDDALGLVEQLTYYDSKSNTCKNYPVDQITYTYDIRDRLTQLQSNLFDWMLYYDANSPSIALAQQNWNGNINGTRADYKFGTSGLTVTNINAASNFTNDKYTDYVYTYDKLNRLTGADAALHNGSLINGGIGDATYSYDKIGNLLSLTRTDPTQTITYNYTYQPVTNKMVGVTASTGMSIIGNYTYNYDNNGNLTYDSKRDVTVTRYGRANLPANLSTTNHNLTYLYDVADLRIYKNQADKGRGSVRSAEWYLRAGGREIAVYDMNRGELTWYIHGSERIAKLKHQLNDGTRTPDIIGGSFADDTENYDTKDEERKDELKKLEKTDSKGEAYLDLPDKLLYVEYPDGTKEYILESQASGNYTVLSFIDLIDENQQLVFTTASGEVLTIGLEELVGLLEDLPSGSTFTGYDPFDIPMVLVINAPTPDLVYYVYDHLGNTRVTYSTAVECDASVAYTLEAVVDYYPYGKELRSYYNEGQEKYLTTQHERDVETGLDYRGARFYDADIGRFLSLDPHAMDYPQFSDYVYVAANPIYFVDPDGRNFVPVVEPNEDGTGGTITITSTIYVQGDNIPTSDELKKIQEDFNTKLSGGSYQVKDEDGKVLETWTINFDVKFEIDQEKTGGTLGYGENIMIYNKGVEQSKGQGGSISNNKRVAPYKSYIQDYGLDPTLTKSEKSQKVFDMTSHEALHQLGLSDRYNPVWNKDKTKVLGFHTHEGWDGDVMAPVTPNWTVSQHHYDNWGKAALKYKPITYPNGKVLHIGISWIIDEKIENNESQGLIPESKPKE